MQKRYFLVLVIIAVVVGLILFFLKPCSAPSTAQVEKVPAVTPPENTKKAEPKASAPISTEKKEATPAKEMAAEVDDAPPVALKGGDQIPNVAKCVDAAFPADAKPYVKAATVSVRLIVDKFGNVRSSRTMQVVFPVEPDEEVLPEMRKLFIQAGNRAFGKKKCPPYMRDGVPSGYSIEVPLQYKQ